IKYPARNASPTIATRTKVANAKTVSLSPTFAIVRSHPWRDRPGGKGGPCRRERLDRVLDGLDLGEVTAGALCEVGRGQRPRAARARRDEAVAERRERGQHALHVLVGEDRGDDGVALARQPGQDIAHAPEVVGAVPDLEGVVAHALEAAGQAHAHVAVDRPAEVGLSG